MNKLNLFFIIISLFIASSCKLGGDRDANTTGGNLNTGGGNNNWPGYTPPPGSTPGGIDCSQYQVVVDNCELYKTHYNQIVDQNYKDATDQCCEDSPGTEHPDRPDDPPASCYGPGIQPPGIPSLPDYRKISIVGHGNSAGVSWSSINDPRYQQYYQGSNPLPFFLTDSRFLIRFAAPPPNQDRGYNDSLGKQCQFVGLPYTKVKFVLGIRKKNSSYNFAEEIIELDTGSCTSVIDITDKISNQYATRDNQLVFEIKNFQTDYPCNVNPDYQVCPYWPLYSNDCFKLDFQFSTDATKDLPN